MAHVGKFYPRLIRPDLGLFNSYGTDPPYRMRLITSGTSSGALTIVWRNQDVISEEPVLDATAQTLDYKFVNPTGTPRPIWCKWFLINPKTAPTMRNLLSVNWYCKFTAGATTYGDFTGWTSGPDLYTGSDFEFLRFSQWEHLVNVGLVNSMADMRYCAARWSDVPTYKPRKLH